MIAVAAAEAACGALPGQLRQFVGEQKEAVA